MSNNVVMQMLAQKFNAHFTFEKGYLTGRLLARPATFSLVGEAAGMLSAPPRPRQQRAVGAAWGARC